MKSIADVELEVRCEIFADRDRSVERAVELGVKAGIEFERARIKAILELSVPPGLEKAMIALALSPTTTPDQAAHFVATFPLDPSHATALRKSFRIIRHEEAHAG